MKKKLLKIVTYIMAFATLMLQISTPIAYALEDDGRVYEAANNFIKFHVNKENGRFTIKTNNGDPYKGKNDANKDLLFEDEYPDTSFTTFKIDGKDYIYGNSYGFLGLGGKAFTTDVKGTISESIWNINELEIKQILTINNNPDDLKAGRVKISYEVTNKGQNSKNVGSRILLDTKVGNDDGTDIICDFTQYSKEKELTGDKIPTIWRSEDDKSIVEAFGFISGWGNTKPDKMIIGHYEGLSNTKWDYKVNEGLDFTSNNNKYGGGDSAVAFYWENVTVAAGETKVFETYYGLGEFLEKHEGLEFPFSISAPNKLTVNSSKTGYEEEVFDITCTLDNNTMKEYTDVVLNLVIPEDSGLSLVDGEKSEKVIQKLEGYEKKEIRFRVKPKAEDHMQVFNYRLEVQAYGMETPKYIKKAIIAPGLKWEMPKVHFKSVAPRTIYIEGSRNFTIQGEGLSALANKDEWYMVLVGKYSSKNYSISNDCIKVSEDSINVSLSKEEEPIPVGVYSIALYSMELNGKDIILPYELKVSNDIKYRLEEYGILSIVKTVPVSGVSGAKDFIYNVELFESEDELKAFKDNIEKQNESAKDLYEKGDETEFKQLLVTLRGKVSEYKNGGERKFYIASDGKEDININEGIRYVGDDLCIIEKDQKNVKITGYGVLGLVGNFDFWKWGFDIDLENGEDYSLNALSSEDIEQYFNQNDANKKELVDENIEYLYMRDKISDAQEDVLIQFLGGGTVINRIFGFHVQINDAVLKEEGVSFGGIMALSFLSRGSNDNKERKFDNSIEVEEALFGKNSSKKTIFKGINAAGNVSLPSDAFSGILSNGSVASVTINSIDKVYGLDFDANIKIIELSGHISIAFTPKNKPVLDDLELMLATPDIKLGPYITITSLGGGINNLYTVLTEDGKTGPPLTIMAAAGFNLIKNDIFEGMLRSEFTKYGVKFNGSLELVPINAEVLKEAWFELRWAEPMYISAGAEIDLKQVVVADLSLYISGKHFEGSANGEVNVPSDWPIIGGRELANVDLGVSSKKLWAAICIDLGLVDPKVGFSYKWKNHDFDVHAKWTMLDGNDGEPENYVYKEIIDMGAGQDDMTLYVGTNMKKLGGSHEPVMYASLDNDFIEPNVYALADDTQHYFNAYNQDMAVFEIGYKDEVPTFELFDPTGKKEVLQQGADKAYLVQANPNGIGGKVYIFVDKPVDGTWKLKVSEAVQSVFYNLETPPSLTSVQASKSGEDVRVQWAAANSEGSFMDIFIAKDKDEAGILIASDIEGSDNGTYTFDIPSGMTADDYYVKVVIKEGEFGYESMYIEDAIYLVDNDAPRTVTNGKLLHGGNGTLVVDYKEVSDRNVQGYYVELLDDLGKKVDKIGRAFVEQGNKKEIVIGGSYEAVMPVMTDEGKPKLDTDGNPITEKVEIDLPRGESYKAAITTVSEENGKVHYSPVVYTNEVFLNEPNPPQVEVKLLNAATDGEDDRGGDIKVIKDSIAKIHLKVDQEVATIVMVNGVKHSTLKENNTVMDVPLKDGENEVKFICENEGLDRTTEEMIFKVDSKAPILKIGEIKEQNNQVIVSGFTEPDGDLRINGQTAVIGDAGNFNHTLSMDNKLIKSVRIESTDDANNKSVYETEVQNESIGKIESVRINPSLKAIKQGSSYEFQLMTRDSSGKEVIINDSLVDWSLLEGNEFGELTNEGVLKADNEGQIVIQAKYLITSDYALEDALVLDITKDGTTLPDQSGGEDNNQTGSEDNNNTGGNSSGSSHSKKSKNKLKQLEDILNDVIARENNLIPVITEGIKASEVVSLKADDLVVTLDKGTLSEEDDMLLIAKLQNPKEYMDNLSKYQFVTDIYEIQLAKSNHNLKKPVKLSFKVDRSKANDGLAVYFYNEEYDSWEYIGGNISGDEITVEVQHFSKYAVINNESVSSMVDIKNRWSEDAVKKLTSLRIVNGLEKDGIKYFEPKRSISRLELAAMVTRVMKDMKMKKKDNPPFVDWNSIADWGKDYARAAYNNGWIKGRDTEEQGLLFAGDEKATRAEVATIIGRLLKDESSKSVTFTDNKEIPSWAKPYIDRLVKSDILSGYPDGTFRPNQAITREEVAKILSNYIERIVNKSK
jgi:hypothetical protein